MNLQQLPSRLDEQPSEPRVLDFDYAALIAATHIFVQQHSSEIKTLMRRATSSVFDIRQKLLKVTAPQIRKNYVFGCSSADSIFDIQISNA